MKILNAVFLSFSLVLVFVISGIADTQNSDLQNKIINIPLKITKPCAEFNLKKENGTYRQFYNDGATFIEVECANNKKHGKSFQYYPNGNVWIQSQYLHGRLEGEYFEYDLNGSVQTERHYKGGKKEGIHKEFYSNGNIKLEENYKNNKLEGVQRTYFLTGDVSSEQKFQQGKLINEAKYYDADGNSRTSVQLTNNDQQQELLANVFNGEIDNIKESIRNTQSNLEEHEEGVRKYSPYISQ